MRNHSTVLNLVATSKIKTKGSVVYKTVLAATISALLMSANAFAQGSYVISENGSINSTEDILINVDSLVSENPNAYAGITVAGPYQAEVNAPSIEFKGYPIGSTDELRFVNVSQNDADITINANLVGDGQAQRTTGILVNGSSTLSINGNIDFDLSAVNSNSDEDPKTSIGIRLENGAQLDIVSDSISLKSQGGDLRGLYVSKSDLNLTASQIHIENNITEDNVGVNQGICLNQSTVTLNGNSTHIVLNGNKVENRGLNLNADQTGQTLLDINSNQLTIEIKGSAKESYGLMNSATTGIMDISSEKVLIDVTDDVAVGMYTQYGAQTNFTNPNAVINLNIHGKEGATGIYNSTYGGKDTFQFGSTKIAGVVNISVESEGDSIGIANQIYGGDSVHLTSDRDGIEILGGANIQAVSTGSNGLAVGLLADNTWYDHNNLQPNAKVLINNLNVEASGNNGATSIGIQGVENSHISLGGTTSVIAEGENSIGMVLQSSDITIEGNASIRGDTLGISANDSAEITLSENAYVTTNSMNSTGVTNLANASTLEVTGGTDVESTLGTIQAQSADIRMGAGSFSISQLNGNNNSLTMTDLANANSVKVRQKNGNLRLVATSASNDQFSNVEATAQALTEIISIEKDEDTAQNTFEVMSGDVNDSMSGDIVIAPDGTLRVENVQTQKNDKLDAYGSVTALAALSLRHEMNSLSKRMGELRDAPEGVGIWMRGYGSEMEYGAQDLTMRSKSVQFGTDQSVGDWKVGVAFTYTDGDTSYDFGSADTKGYGVAVYGTWFVPCGAYVDLMAKYNRLENDFALNGMDGDYNSNAYGVSVETGYRFEFLDGGLYLEPQVGVNYGHIEGETIKTSNNVRIDQDSYDSIIGRAGLRAGFKFPENKGTIYARLSGLYDFDGEVSGTAAKGVAHNTIEEDLGGAWVEMGVGANFNWTENTYTYIDFERTNGGDVKENYRWNVGIRHTF